MDIDAVEKAAKALAQKQMPFAEKVNEAQTARRFGVSREDVKAAIDDIASSRESTIEVSITKRKEELQEYLRHVYDEMAKEWGFENMIYMMATAHTEIIARSITNPEKFSQQGIRALRDLQPLLYPIEKATMRRTLPPGDDRDKVLDRLKSRLLEVGEPQTLSEEADELSTPASHTATDEPPNSLDQP